MALPGGDVLLLAGDIMEAKELGRANYNKNWVMKPGDNPGLREDRFLRFMNEEVTKYNKAFYIAGNHEHWGTKLYKTHTFMRENVPANTTVLEDEICVHEGVLFLGATFWTDFNKGDGLTMYHAGQAARDSNMGMRDYKYIKHRAHGIYRKLIPKDILEIHYKSRAYFNHILSENRQKENPLPVVVMTHHAPTALSIPQWYKNDYLMNGCYYSDQSEMILDNPQIKAYVHGHTHEPFKYQVGDTWVICNPRGYYGYEARAYDYSPLEFEVNSDGDFKFSEDDREPKSDQEGQ
jgi:predicted phosphodiesterase